MIYEWHSLMFKYNFEERKVDKVGWNTTAIDEEITKPLIESERSLVESNTI